MPAYTGEEVTDYERHIETLKDAFETLLPEFIDKGRQQQFTNIKDSFPRVRSNGVTDPAALARAQEQDETLITSIHRALASCEFIRKAFENQELNNENLSRDEDTAMQTYKVLHAQNGLILQSLRTSVAYTDTSNLFGEVSSSEYNTEITLKLSEFRDASEDDKKVLKLEIETACRKFLDAKTNYKNAFQKFSEESMALARLRKKTFNINFTNHVFLNSILCQESAKVGSLSLTDYFNRQERLWDAGLQSLIPAPPPQVAAALSPTRSNQNRSNLETKKFNSNRVALGKLLEEISQEMSKLSLEQLKFSLGEIQTRHKVVEDLSLDPDVTSDSEVAVLSDSRKLMRSLIVKIESKSKDDKTSDEKRKQEASANLKALGTVTLPNLTGFSDYLAWKKAQERLNTHVDGFKKAAVLLSTLKNPNDKSRCQGIYDYDELMAILKTKYSHQEKLIPALINKLRNLPHEPQSNEVMQRSIDAIQNVYCQLKSISEKAVRRFDQGVVNDMVLKLTREYQLRYEDFAQANKDKPGFSVFRFGEEGSVVETIISGSSREENRLPVDYSDASILDRNLFLAFLKDCEMKLANVAARHVNLCTSSGGSKFQKCSKCRTKPCKCKKPPRSAAYTVQVTDAEKVCPVCPTIKPHINRNRKPTKCLSACKAFREKPVKERKAIVKSTKACHVCLNQGHFAKDCTRTYKCNKCQGAHNILLCDRAQVNPSRPSSAPSAPPMEEIDADSNFVKSNHGSSYLAVSGAKAIDSRSRVHELTCLWDSGSQLNFILDSTAKLLGFRGEPVQINLTTVGSFSSPVKCMRYWITLKSNSNKNLKIAAYSIPSIGQRKVIPPKILKSFEKLFNLHQSKINNQHGPIDLLMGIPNLGLHPTRVKLVGNLELLKSQFGKPFMIIGSVQGHGNDPVSCNFIDATIREYVTNDSLGLNLTPRCSVCLKTPPCKSCKLLTQPVSFKEQEEAKLIKQSMEFDYEKKEVRVSYPYIKDPAKVFPPDQSNYKLASKLATNLKRSLTRDGLLKDYSENWHEMIDRGVIRELSEEEIESWESAGNPTNYCSHHAVLKDTKSTKVRIVTNSSLAHNGTSLNAILPKGPNSISNLLHVMLRFRSKPYLVIADLSKAYNSIKTSELDAHLRRFLWYSAEDLWNPDAKLRVFVLDRMHFGDTPSGYYLESAKEEISNYARDNLKQPILSEKILSESYVDDFVPTFESLKEAKEIKESLPLAFGALGFRLKEVTVNGPGVKLKSKSEPEQLLGQLYHYDTDQIQLKFVANFSKKRRGQKTQPNLTSSSKLDSIPITKRSVLSLLASQYDPTGLASPFIAKYKIFMAKLFKNPNYKGWDTPVNDEDKRYGMKLVREIIYASEKGLRFDRCNKPEGFKLKRIVCFSDGSIVAFQTVLYGVYVGPHGEVHTSLLTAKNRVSSESVPRAELNALVAGCRLILNYIEAVPECSQAEEIQFFSDSTCCMDWIRNYPLNDVYVVNRVLEIHKSVRLFKIPSKFFWIRSGLNIADIGTRSDCKFTYLSSDEWQKGPSWMRDVDNSSAQLKHFFNTEEENMAMAYKAAIEPDPDEDDIWSNLLKTHSLKKVLRVWCLIKGIFVNKSFKAKCSSTVTQMDEAFKFFVKLSQEEKPVEELKTKQLVMFKENGILWTKMRFPDDTLKQVFNKSQLPVLSSRSRLGKLLLRQAHSEKMFRSIHAGIHQTLVNSRVGPFGVYITHAKQSIRGIISKCVVCRKTALKTQDAKMAPRRGGFGTIPKDGSAFDMIAVDYFGPFLAKPPRGRETRGTKFFKIWGMAVLCQQTRAIKAYPIEGYDTQSFLTVFKTHCALHGVPTSVLSDPMSAFVSGAKVVGESTSTDLQIDDLADDIEKTFGVKWTFIPPGSQWRDPAERAIKSIKQMMDSVFSCEKGKPVLTLNEYWCLFSEISEMLNRRPIQGAIFEGTVSLISPNQLILGRTSKDQPVTLPETMKVKERLQLISDIKASFWKAMISVFAGDSRLFKYTTWYKQSRVPKVNDIVLLLYKSKIKDSYRIARIVNVSQDGRNLEILVASIQDSSASNFKLASKLSVPTQRTILLYSPTDDSNESRD